MEIPTPHPWVMTLGPIVLLVLLGIIVREIIRLSKSGDQ